MIPPPTQHGRSGDWFATYSGTQFYLTDPHPGDVLIKDIAHALSMVCRFGGHTREFYSVAQHCVHCSELVESWGTENEELQLHTLLHDASEAYLGDVVRPLKYSMPDYLQLEERMMEVIYQGLDLSLPCEGEQRIIKEADDTLLMTERRDFINHRNLKWGIHQKPLETLRLTSLSPTAAEYQFITRYDNLRAKLARMAA